MIKISGAEPLISALPRATVLTPQDKSRLSNNSASIDLACKQSPKWGYRAKRKIGELDERSAVGGLDFCFRSTPHLGACSQASIDLDSSREMSVLAQGHRDTVLKQ